MPFGGETYNRGRDYTRLKGQLLKVFRFMQDREWHTLAPIVSAAGGTTASVTARLRDLRKKKFGGYIVQANCIKRGLWEYRMPTATQLINEA